MGEQLGCPFLFGKIINKKMIYFVLFLLLLGFWQMFMHGRKSNIISGASFWIAIILLIAGLIFGKIELDIKAISIIILIGIIVLNYTIRNFEFYENLNIREILYTFREFKEKYPTLSEDGICRLTIYSEIKRNYQLYNTFIGPADKQIKMYIEDSLKKQLTLKNICIWNVYTIIRSIEV